MAKIRVYELARDLKVDSKTLLAKMKEMGIGVAGHQSTLTTLQIEKIRLGMSAGQPKVVVRRRRKPAEEAPTEEVAPVAAAVEQPQPKKKREVRLEVDRKELSKIDAKAEEKAKARKEVADRKEEKAKARAAVSRKLEVEVPAAMDVEKLRDLKKLAQEAPPKPRKKDRDKEKPREKEKAKPKLEAEEKSKKKAFSGATIVRRATPAEVEETKALEEARQRTSRREDSRGIRVTGIGVNPRMDAPEEGASGGAKKNSQRGANLGDVVPAGLGEDSSARTAGRGRKDGGKGDSSRSSEDRLRLSVSASKRRLNMRDLLDQGLKEEKDAWRGPRRKKTVYTPQKKRDKRRSKETSSTQITTPRAAYRIVKMESATIKVTELARQLQVKAGDLIAKLMAQGTMVTMNQDVDFDTAALVAGEYGYECKSVEKTAEGILGYDQEKDGRPLVARSPVITVMGHVDHGKTSILDGIRKTHVADGESGGITQHIGAYMVEREGFRCTFLDTPGHAAFAAMRARGAQVTDIVVLVVAADDGVKPQTKEAVAHAKDAGVPLIVAVNKMDKPNIDLDRIYSQLSELGVQAEDWGGDTQFVKVSALKQEGLDNLLEAIQLQSEILELKAPAEGRAQATVVEAHLDTGRGPVATVIIRSGRLKLGEYLVAGVTSARVRAMYNHLGVALESAGPAEPVELVGLSEVPAAGDQIDVVESEKQGRELVSWRKRKAHEEVKKSEEEAGSQSLDDLLSQNVEIPQVKLIIKADTQGSLEAISYALGRLNSDKVKNVILHKGVGRVNDSDMALAVSSQANILGFNLKESSSQVEAARKGGVELGYYTVIYELLDWVKASMIKALPPITTEILQGRAEVRNAIVVPKLGTIAGSAVMDGKITRVSRLRVIRDEAVIFKGRIGSLRRFKDDVKEVANGYECGISIDGYSDIKVGDVIEAFMLKEEPGELKFAEDV